MCAKISFLLVIVVLLNSAEEILGHEKNKIRLKLQQGEIEGRKTRSTGRNTKYYSFQGIPYAKPPLDDLRFAAPQPSDNWNGVLDATKPANTCIEMYFENRGQEDCLYLNVFTPALDKNLPVMIWIHGGAFVFIYGNYTLNGVDFFMDEEIVFVTVHYRMGPFGFLSTEDDVIPGNFGLKDQVMAINWVHDNIKAFGGDPKRITLMGQSAGAVSTSYMGMTPQLNGKINGIIQQSGSSLCPFGFGRYHRVGAYVLSTKSGLQSQNSTAILEHLRKIDAQLLRKNALSTHIDIAFGRGTFHGLLYIPGLESRTNKDSLITELSHEQLKQGHFNKVPRMIGINSMEAIFIIDEFKTINESYNNYDQMIRRYIPVSMNTRNEEAGHLIKKHYTNNTAFVSNITNMVHFGSDDQFVRPILKDAALVSKHVTTYLYHFSYQGELGLSPRPLKGVNHGEEVEYLFHNKDHGNISEEDERIRRKLVRLWANFAKYSNPTPQKDRLLDNQIWLPIDKDSDDVNYVDIGEKIVPSVNPHQEDVLFWDDLYKTYGNPPYDTY